MFKKKGSGEAVSALILFITALIITTGIVLALNNYFSDTQDSLRLRKDILSNQLRTTIKVSNVVYNSTSQQALVYVKNIGETKLDTNKFDLFIDDTFYSSFSVFEASNSSASLALLEPQQTALIIQNVTLNSGSHDLVVVSEYGAEATSSFNI